jgi:hypothetical protein
MDTCDETIPEDLLPLLSRLHEYVEEGIQEAHQYFESRRCRIDPWMFSHQVRFHVRNRLLGLPDLGLPCHHVRLAFSGIDLTYNTWRLKILKATIDGNIPGPGRSYSRQAFYNYNLFPDWQDEEDEEDEEIHLLIIWHVDEYYNFHFMELADPANREIIGRVPYPETLPPPSDQSTASQEQDLPELDLPEDLDIEETGSGEP